MMKIFFRISNAEVSTPHKVFTNNSSANIKFSKAQLHKIGK